MSAPPALLALVEASRARKLAEARRRVVDLETVGWLAYASTHWSEIPAGGPGSMFEAACAVVARCYPASAGKVACVGVRSRGAGWELMALHGAVPDAATGRIELTGDGCVWTVPMTDADVTAVFGARGLAKAQSRESAP